MSLIITSSQLMNSTELLGTRLSLEDNVGIAG